MGNVVEMLDERLIDLNVTSITEVELFEKVGLALKDLGFVNDGYINGIKERESKFPTGLITPYLNIALPHSDTQYIENPFIYVVRLDEPVSVKQMGDNQEMEVKHLFFLGIKEPSKQVGLLSMLMSLFQDEKFVTEFKNTNTTKEVYQLLLNNFTKMEED